MKSDRIECDWRITPRKPGWESRAGGREHVLWHPDRPTFRVYASGNGWRLSAHGQQLLPEHRGKVWETAREAAMAAKEYAQTERGEPQPAPETSPSRCMVATPPAAPSGSVRSRPEAPAAAPPPQDDHQGSLSL